MEEYRVFITTSGIGSRLGKLTDFTNKSLVRVGSKPAITRIIESYPKESSFVITLGYYGNHVKEYLEIAHPSTKFTFVEVDKFSGEGSSQLYSMNCARQELQCPFIFHACDTIIDGKITPEITNWVAGTSVENADQYRTLSVNPSFKFDGFNEKGELSFDYAYPGICGIKDYELFWKLLQEILTEGKKELSDCDVINRMIPILNSRGEDFQIVEMDNWHDIGNVSELEKTRSNFKESFDVLDKPRENIYFLEDSVVKFFHDKSLTQKRTKRAEILTGLVPDLTGATDHFFKYDFVDGSLFADTANPIKMKSFLEWVSTNMWNKKVDIDISKECYDFYFTKTKNRISQLLGSDEDDETTINGEKIPPINDLISKIDEQWLCSGMASLVHGDLILDNVIETNSGFVLIDWRQDFANMLDVGDVYYLSLIHI